VQRVLVEAAAQLGVEHREDPAALG
jgi:hypothetical protein